MDTSKEYLEMCKKAEEIQSEWKVSAGDRVYGGTNVFILERENVEAIKRLKTQTHFILLPCQDQLQEMVENSGIEPNKYGNTFWILQKFYRFVKNGEGYWHSFENCPYPTPSMEQLWLAFVMHEKYQKYWTGNEWVR